ncbi:MAG: hypothetical protein ACRDY0_07735, partial [Acidimicrobiales bacterium]
MGQKVPPRFIIGDGALQWRIVWTCGSGHLTVDTSAQARRPLVSASCPGTGIGYGTQTGPIDLSVDSAGAWQLQIDQEVDVPLEEAP